MKKPMGRPRVCRCGCGRKVTPGSLYIRGHHRRGVKLSDAVKVAIGEGRRKQIKADVVV